VEDKRSRLEKLDNCSPTSIESEGPQSSFSAKNASSLHVAIQSYEKIIKTIRLDLPDSARAAVDLTLSYIRLGLPADVLGLKTAHNIISGTAFPQHCAQNTSAERSTNNQRYLGEASDVRFYHTIREILRDGDQSGGVPENDIQSYDQGILHLERQDQHDIHTDLPTRELADEYINIYFSTIHIAYPFICKPSFMELYERFWKGDLDITENSSWLPLMCRSRTCLNAFRPVLTKSRHHLRYRSVLYFISSIGKR
jgi:hypothetical protein